MKRLFEIVDRHPVIYIFVTVLLLMVGINYMASLKLERIERQRQTEHAQTREEFLEKVYGVDLAEDYKRVLLEQSLGYRYYPFVEYVEKARNGKFVNVSNQGTRCHYSNREFCTARGGMKEVWIFGGSTTFGYGVKDNETIAAYLAELLPEYRIVNFGAASYYSTIERIRFENLLIELMPPKAAVFIDGVNDFYYFNVPDETVYSPILKAVDEIDQAKALGDNIRALLGHLAIYRLLDAKFGLSTKKSTPGTAVASPEQISKAIARFHLNHSIVKDIGNKLGVTILTVLQPTPTYGVGHKTSNVPRELLNFGDHENSGLAYREMLTPNGELRTKDLDTLNLANLGINEGMYIDTVHYSPLFNKKIALEISKKLKASLKVKKKIKSNQSNILLRIN